jgi:hypothetical protein
MEPDVSRSVEAKYALRAAAGDRTAVAPAAADRAPAAGPDPG